LSNRFFFFQIFFFFKFNLNVGSTLNHPMSLTMDDSSLLYIADYGNNRIVRCNLTTNQSKIYIEYNQNGNRNTYVLTPISIKYDSQSNSLVIAQQFGYNVVRWKLDSNSWTLIAGSASSQLSGRSRTLFNQLCNLNIDQFNSTYVVDCFNQRIQYYRGDLTQGKTIAGVIQASGNSSYLFNNATSITFDDNYNLYVADSYNYRIQKFPQLVY